MPIIVLWDIDHTLIENSGVSKEIYAAAFSALTGRLPSTPAPTEGRTDRLILVDMFRQHGLPAPDWPAAESALVQAGAARFEELRRRGHILPGVVEVLRAVRDEESAVSSILTGNIEPNARIKLAAFGLDAFVDLAVGAYGADSSERGALVDIARERVRAAYGVPLDTPVVLIGDTPRDVEAAMTGGAHIIAVASGVHTAQDLKAAGAEVVLPDLRDTATFMTTLRSLKRPHL